MRHVATFVLIIGLASQPALAQETAPPEEPEGLSLMEQGARLFMQGIMREMEPAIDEFRKSIDTLGPAFTEFAQSAGPALAALLDKVDDIRHYEAPEFLPNGDIIIRRSPDAPAWRPDPVPDTGTGEIEL